MGLDEKAVATVSNWQFQPGLKNGQPVNVQAQVQVNFRLLEKGGQLARWHLSRAEFHVADGSVRPFLQKSKAPHASADPTSATSTLKFDIDETGLPVNVRTENSSDDGWSRDVTDALREWKFTPATKDGMPVSASCIMEFVRGDADHLTPPLDTRH
jgi:outer membrane biosynthesis protein TonB